MKGLSKFVEYTFLILFGFTVLSLLTSMIYSYYSKTLERNINTGLKQTALQTSEAILKLYNTGQDVKAEPENASTIIVAAMDINYPNNIGGRNFEVDLISSPGIWVQVTNLTIDSEDANIRKETSSGAKILVKTTQDPFLSYEYPLANIAIEIQGKYTAGSNDTLSYIRYNYLGTEYDVIVLGDFDFIVGVDTIKYN